MAMSEAEGARQKKARLILCWVLMLVLVLVLVVHMLYRQRHMLAVACHFLVSLRSFAVCIVNGHGHVLRHECWPECK